MSTHKTQNYNLHSWLPQDEFHLTEINENFALLDAALKAEAQAAATERTALNTAIGARARIIVGSYPGAESISSNAPQRIELGVRPKAIILASDKGFQDIDAYARGGLVTEACDLHGAVVIDDTGFTVRNISPPKIWPNSSSYVYHYLVLY